MSAPTFVLAVALSAGAATCATACSGGATGERSFDVSSTRSVIRITGSDTMVNLVQAFAENYAKVRPAVSVQVAGGGSGVGIAGLIDGVLDIAAAGRQVKADEIQRATAHNGSAPQEFIVALDALAVYVNEHNPLDSISLEELAEIYGEHGQIRKWSQLGARNPACRSDDIIRVSRQNNSGTYAYFREVILGGQREYELGSIDQSGSKDVVGLVSHTPCAIGYSGMAFATSGARALKISTTKVAPAIAPTAEAVIDGSYPIARPLYLYTPGEPQGHTKDFLAWVLGGDGQEVVRAVGFVPVPTIAVR
jgi:phosphate transport system substrate-binding protein